MSAEKKDIIIIGGGLTGLTLGFYLKKAGKNILIIEKEMRTGGVINTVEENGFVYETGPNTGVISTIEAALLFEDLRDRCSLETASSGSEKRYILKKGKWEALPSGLFSAIATPLFTIKDKFRILGEPLRKQGSNNNETIADLVIRRLGRSYLDYAVDPFISGIYAGDPATLVTRFALPKLYALEQNYGSFIRGAIAKSRTPKSENEKKATRKVFSVRGGLENLVRSLADETGYDNIMTSCNNTTVEKVAESYAVNFRDGSGADNTYIAPVVVTTIGGNDLHSLLPFIPEGLMKRISELRYAGVVQVAAGFRRWSGRKLDAFGGLVPTVEKRDILGILFPSAIFGGRAPEEGALLSLFLGGIKNPALLMKTDDELRSIVMKEIADTLAQTGEADLLKIHRYTHAIPQYDLSTGDRLEAIREIQQLHPGLIIAGNIRDGIGMADRIRQAREISQMLI